MNGFARRCRLRMSLPPLSAALLIVATNACVTVVDLPVDSRGGLQNPIVCDSPENQRQFLRRLQRADGERPAFEYESATMGPEDQILDRFRVENPAIDERDLVATVADLFREKPQHPPWLRLYMSIYGPRCADGPPPGFTMP